jgi:hypothetical protein
MTATRYAQLARRHWEQFRPRELAAISDPEAFCATKGQELQAAVIELQEAMEQAIPPEREYPARVGQLNQIRADAEHRALTELLPPPEDETSHP